MTAVAMGVACVGCGNSFPGTWVSENSFACGHGQEHITLEVHDDLSGEGSFCECKFTFVASDRGDDTYRLELAFADICVFDLTNRDCELKRSGDRLDCGDLETGSLGEYLRAGE